MKKLIFSVLCTSLAFAGFAQNEAKALFESGKAKMGKFDSEQVKMQMRQAIDSTLMCESLMGGYEDFLKALPLDTIRVTEKDGSPKIDKKTGLQQIKTKYSKDIVGLIAGHHNDFAVVGSIYNERRDYLNAAKAWEIYVALPEAEFLGKDKPVLADSTAGMFAYYTGVMYYQVKDNKKAYDSFVKAIKKGYSAKEAQDMLKYESQMVVSAYLEAKDYDACEKFLDKAIADFPQEALFVMFKGIILETKTDNIENAIDLYKKATELDPTLAQAQYHVGRYYNNNAVNLMNADENNNLNDAELAKIINPY
ncbi:MAG: tetratricopeptide repeat protein, partial [Muribaculaceae bacterium]